MLSDLLTRKYTRLFSILDIDRDGFINQADYERVSRLCAVLSGFGPDTNESKLLVEWFTSAWGRLQSTLAMGQRDRLSLEEYLRIHQSFHVEQERFQIGFRPGIEFLFTLADKNGDGRLDEQDLVRIGQAFSIDALSVSEAHRRIDTDRDGFIDKTDMLKRLDEFCFSDDPTAPGNWLLGNF